MNKARIFSFDFLTMNSYRKRIKITIATLSNNLFVTFNQGFDQSTSMKALNKQFFTYADYKCTSANEFEMDQKYSYKGRSNFKVDNKLLTILIFFIIQSNISYQFYQFF